MPQRDINLDFLRVAAALAVVLLHVSATVVLNHPDVSSTEWWIGNFYDALTRWCVPVFVMISGALLLSKPGSIEPIEFYRNSALRILTPLVSWTIFYIAVRTYIDGKLDLVFLSKNIILGQPHFHLWYLYMLVSIYLMTPFLRIFVQASSRSTLILFCLITFTLSSLETTLATLFKGGGNTFLSLFLPYISYFVSGHLLNTGAAFYSTRKTALFTIFLGIFLAVTVGVAYPFLGPKTWAVMYSNFNPIVIIMSLTAFQFGRSIKIVSTRARMAITRMAPLTLGIYLIHPFWLDRLGEFSVDGFSFHSLLGIPLTFSAALILSILSIALLAHIPLVKSTVQ